MAALCQTKVPSTSAPRLREGSDTKGGISEQSKPVVIYSTSPRFQGELTLE